ncbi:hypothetical protein NDU88_003281 [Pleurodeles waltl]|uniref:Uncharacterized protein n=1 Tax=Pleurodeles waltl TaxID=8319 RepID=A0AAV7WNN2_PLEWA|nr:hypothetical protein NDU88_003281 [Pleurodeles waltl]
MSGPLAVPLGPGRSRGGCQLRSLTILGRRACSVGPLELLLGHRRTLWCSAPHAGCLLLLHGRCTDVRTLRSNPFSPHIVGAAGPRAYQWGPAVTSPTSADDRPPSLAVSPGSMQFH